MKVGIFSVHGHMCCLGFLFEVLKKHDVSIVITDKTDHHLWIPYYNKLYTFNIVYDLDTDVTQFDKIIKLTSNETCLNNVDCISLVHLKCLMTQNNVSKKFITLSPYIEDSAISYMFPCYSNPKVDKLTSKIVTFVGYCLNNHIDEDTDMFITQNPEYTFKFIVWGDGNYSNLTKHTNVSVLHNIHTTEMVDIINKSKFILSKKYINYDRFSGQLGLAVSFDTPLLIDSRTSNAYKLPGFTFNHNYTELGRLDNISNEDYINAVNNISMFKIQSIETNQKTIDELLDAKWI
jgi:hypothetical protein